MQQQQKPFKRPGARVAPKSDAMKSEVRQRTEDKQSLDNANATPTFDNPNKPRRDYSDNPVPRGQYHVSYVNKKRIDIVKERGYKFVDLNGRTETNLRDDMPEQPVIFVRIQNQEGTLPEIDSLLDIINKPRAKREFNKSNEQTENRPHHNKKYDKNYQGRNDSKPTYSKPLPKAGPKPKDNFKDPRGQVTHEKGEVNPKYFNTPDSRSPFYAALKDFKASKK